MRAWPIELTKPEFDRIFYRHVTNVCAENVEESLVSIRLLEKIEDPEFVDATDPSQDVIDKAEAADEPWFPLYKLAIPVHIFHFEEDEKDLAVKRLEANIGRLTPRLGAEFEIVRQKLITAEPIDLTPAAEEVGPAEEVPLRDVSSLLKGAAEKTAAAEAEQAPADA